MKKKEGQGSISWKSGAYIGIQLFYGDHRDTITLSYNKTDHDGKKHDRNYSVFIVSKPSNLGKGQVYYLLCPFTWKRCKILYMGYGSLYFKSREAYRHRIYYPSQLSSQQDKHKDKYWSLERKLERLYKAHPKRHYRGKNTRIMQRIE